jgi:hypothetical protein
MPRLPGPTSGRDCLPPEPAGVQAKGAMLRTDFSANRPGACLLESRSGH